MYKAAFIFIGLGIFCFWVIYKGYARSLGGTIFVASYSMIYGVLMLIGAMLEDEAFFGAVLSIGLAGIFLLVGVWCMIEPFVKFTRKTEGTFIDAVRDEKDWYSPRFQYRVDGTLFWGKSAYIYRERTIYRRYKENQVYIIWYSKDDPTFYIDARRIGKTGIYLFGMGMVILWIAFYCIL